MKVSRFGVIIALAFGVSVFGSSCQNKSQSGNTGDDSAYLEKSSLSASDSQLIKNLKFSPEKATTKDLESLCKSALSLDPDSKFYPTIITDIALIMALNPNESDLLKSNYSQIGSKMLDTAKNDPNMLIYGISLIKKSHDKTKLAQLQNLTNHADPIVREKAVTAINQLKS